MAGDVLGRPTRRIDQHDKTIQAAVGAFDVPGTGTDAAQRAGFIELAAVAAHERVVGSEGIEHLLHIAGRDAIFARYAGPLADVDVDQLQDVAGVIAGGLHPFFKRSGWTVAPGTSHNQDLIGGVIVGIGQQPGDGVAERQR